ncbi:MAG TPA: mannose-6-phosphate isomerase, class I [Acidothermaceae bacterium]|nr:mannose-6-phosphate isomerase, class I [Acidothermaceae bacterium]
MTVRRLVNPVMAYAWGSRDAIATLQGRSVGSEPEAELWMGAHPQAPSRLEHADGLPGEGLDAVIAADPVGVLGSQCVERFGPRLPFLLKVLSAAAPLSLQVHPDAEQARRGFAAEEAAGIDAAAPNRCYRDPYAKPEMLVALTDFHVLQGFRAANEAASVLKALDVAGLEPLIEALEDGTPTGAVFLRLIEWPMDDRARLVGDVHAASLAGALGAPHGIARWIDLLAATYPNDPGVVGVLLLNYLTLRPLDGLYVRPGQIHAYLHGTGVEILGGSDNVIRGGLTPKHVSAEDLRVILNVQAVEPSLVAAAVSADGGQVWPTPQPEFELERYEIVAMRRLAPDGPSVLLCIEGQLEIGDRDGSVALGPGESAFAFAGTDLDVAGHGVLMRANPGSR